MTDFMFEVMELLEQGETVVAKMGEKADPQELAVAVLNYCEAVGYTIEELSDLDLALVRVIRENTRKCQSETKISVTDDLLP